MENTSRDGNTRPPYMLLEKSACRSRRKLDEHGAMDRFQIGKGVHQSCTLSTCLFNLYAEYNMQNAGLDEAPARIKIVGRNISNLRYADDTNLMAESEEKLKSPLRKVKEKSAKADLKTQYSKN